MKKLFYTFLFTAYKKISSLSAEEGKMKLKKLCIYSIKGVAKHILYMTKYIFNRKNLQIKSIDSNFDNKQIVHCPDLTFGIISFNSFFNIEY